MQETERKKVLPCETTAVVAGTTFGSDFAADQHAGFRVHYFNDELRKVLKQYGITDEEEVASLCKKYQDYLLKKVPAVNDETGSFTPSSLSSRITKIYDFHGGAGTLDAGFTTGLAALDQAVSTLRTGNCDVVFCAAGSRCLRGIPFKPDFTPAEGAGVLMLKRLSDAKRDGDKIHFVVRSIGCGFDADPEIAFEQAIEKCWKQAGTITPADVAFIEGSAAAKDAAAQELQVLRKYYHLSGEHTSQILPIERADMQFGNVLGGSAMVSLLTANTKLAKQSATQAKKRFAAVSSWDPLGSAYHAVIESGTSAETVCPQFAEPAIKQTIFRLQADTQAELLKAIADYKFSPSDTIPAFTKQYRLAIVANGDSALSDKLELAKTFAFSQHENVLPSKGIFVGKPLPESKTAFLFPGQGSQYAGMLKTLIENYEPAKNALTEVNADLQAQGLPCFETLAWEQTENLGCDVFHTQLSLLCADTILFRTLLSLDIKPAVTAGHSFGEFPALTSAGVWSFADAVKATKIRCDEIINAKSSEGAMLSTNWNETLSQEACAAVGGEVFVANINAPDQTILGGTYRAIAAAEDYIKSKGGLAKVIPVPRPFHTQMMRDVRQPLYDKLNFLCPQTPSIPVFSSITNDYVRDENKIRSNLADQMTMPVRWIDLITKLKDDGVNIFIECGPNQVLTQLNRKILAGHPAVTLAADTKQGNSMENLLCIKACLEVFAGSPAESSQNFSLKTQKSPLTITEEEFNSLTQTEPKEFDGFDFCRFVMRMVQTPLLTSLNKAQFNGRCLIFGSSGIAKTLAEKIKNCGGEAVIFNPADENMTAVESLWKDGALTHLFITDFDGYLPLFCAVQKWYKLLLEDGLLAKGSLVGIVELGGSFGFDGKVKNADSGVVTGIIKSLSAEAGMQTNYSFRTKIIDFSGEQSAEFKAEAVLNEWAANAPYSIEIGYIGKKRYLARMIPQFADSAAGSQNPALAKPSGNWIITGGGRGVTAAAAKALAEKYKLTLYILGSSPVPVIDERWCNADEKERDLIKQELRITCRERGGNFMKEWKIYKRNAELSETMYGIAKEGITAHYYQCDVSNYSELKNVIALIRMSGSIDGVLHGAGIELSGKLEQKSIAFVEKTIAVKYEGVKNLIDLLFSPRVNNTGLAGQEPKHFVAFGSVAGRVTSPGQTDYASANEMMAKRLDQLQTEKPDCRVVCYEWGNWGGGIGMAGRPQAAFSTEGKDWKSMPLDEGILHFLNEFITEQRTTEAAFVDWKIYKTIYPILTDAASASVCSRFPLLDADRNSDYCSAAFVPSSDLFLQSHRLLQRPLLPAAVTIETFLETLTSLKPDEPIAALHNIVFKDGIRFQTDETKQVKIRLEYVPKLSGDTVELRLVAPFYNSKGVLVIPEKTYALCTAEFGISRMQAVPFNTAKYPQMQWNKIQYVSEDTMMYHGPIFQQMSEFAIPEPNNAVGKVIVKPLAEFAGQRSSMNWLTHPAVIDAGLYLAGVFVWMTHNNGIALPQSIGTFRFGRMPKDNEKCFLHVVYTREEKHIIFFDIVCFGEDGEPLYTMNDYGASVIPASVK